MKKMVVIGHSQGGLLTKLTAIESGTRFWENRHPLPLMNSMFPPRQGPSSAEHLL